MQVHAGITVWCPEVEQRLYFETVLGDLLIIANIFFDKRPTSGALFIMRWGRFAASTSLLLIHHSPSYKAGIWHSACAYFSFLRAKAGEVVVYSPLL